MHMQQMFIPINRYCSRVIGIYLTI